MLTGCVNTRRRVGIVVSLPFEAADYGEQQVTMNISGARTMPRRISYRDDDISARFRHHALVSLSGEHNQDKRDY